MSLIVLLQSSPSMNESALNEYNKELNKYAQIREYFLVISEDLPMDSIGSIKLQASALAKITNATNQLTRNASVLSRQIFLCLQKYVFGIDDGILPMSPAHSRSTLDDIRDYL